MSIYGSISQCKTFTITLRDLLGSLSYFTPYRVTTIQSLLRIVSLLAHFMFYIFKRLLIFNYFQRSNKEFIYCAISFSFRCIAIVPLYCFCCCTTFIFRDMVPLTKYTTIYSSVTLSTGTGLFSVFVNFKDAIVNNIRHV